MRRRGWATAAGVTLAVAGCLGHDPDYVPPIAVQPGAAARAMAFTEHLRGRPAADAGAEAEAGDAEGGVAEGGGGAPEPLAPGETAFFALSCVEARGEPWHALQRAPCRVRFEGTEGTDPKEVPSPGGTLGVAVAPGRYRVTATRGPEYAETRWEATALPGVTTRGPAEGALVLRRVVDSTGYLAADLSDGGPLTPERIASLVADGVELALGDGQATIRAMRLEDRIGALPSIDAEVVPVDRARGVSELLARLRDGRPAVPVNGPGARTFIAVEDDTAMWTWGPTRTDDVRKGLRERRDVVVTTGPFLRVKVNDLGIGGVVRARGGNALVRVHVETGAAAAVDRVSVLRASGEAKVEAALVSRSARGGLAGDVDLVVPVKADDALVVVAEGPAPRAWAVSRPIWIDADGDGESLGCKETK